MSEEMLFRGDRFERLRALTEVSRALTYTTSIEEVLQLAVHRAAELMGADRALIMLGDAEGLLTVRAAWGVDDALVRAFREPLNETLIRRLQGLLDYPSEECFLSVPLVVQGEVTGLLAAVRSSGAACTADDEWLLSALADQAAVALENARLNEAVREEQDERSRVIQAQDRVRATLSHELRSPLTAIQAYAALLLEGLFGDLTDRQRESIARIQLSGRHLLSVIENVLEAARLQERTLPLANGPVQVARVLAEAAQMLHPTATAKHQTLRVDVADPLVLDTDADHLRQVLVNLLGNAIKYTPQGGEIHVSVGTTRREGRECAAVAVADTGRGIPPDLVGRIFEPYTRGDSSRDEPGVGLGLFIARELVRRMDGDIEVQSEPGTGSTFTVILPLSRD